MKKILKNKNLIIVILILLFVIIFNAGAKYVVYADNNIATSAKAMIVYEGAHNKILYSNNCNERLPMASTTKIATAIVAIEHCDDLDKTFVVSDNAVGIEGTSIYLQENEEVNMRQLLLGLMLASGNDCAVAIAEYFGYDIFMNWLNELPTSLGLTNTHFDNPHGLDSSTHYTSAYDLAVITDYALDNEIFREIVSTKRAVIEETNLSNQRYLKHKNKLLFSMENCIGVKTGFTDNAGRCLVNAHEENNMRIISVVLNCGPMFDECKYLTNKALEEYEVIQFIEPYSYVTDINVINGEKNKISLVTINGFSDVIKNEDRERYSIKYDIPQNIEAPVELNSVIGKVYVYFDDQIVYSDNVYAIDGTKNIDIRHIIDDILTKW